MIKRILVVEPEFETIDILGQYFSDQNIDFIKSDDIDEALEVLNSVKIDMVIADVALARQEALALKSRINESFSDIPFLMVASHGHLLEKVDYQDSALVKPFDCDVLKSTIHQAIF